MATITSDAWTNQCPPMSKECQHIFAHISGFFQNADRVPISPIAPKGEVPKPWESPYFPYFPYFGGPWADVENQVTNMAGRAGARYEVQKVQEYEYAEKIPEAVRPYGPAVPDVDGTFMDAKEAQALLRDMLRLARAAEAFLTSGTRATACASAGTWESEHSKEWSVLCSGWPKWVQFVVSYVWKGPRCSFKASVRSVVQHVCRAVSVLEFPVPLSRKVLVLEQHPLQSHLSPVHEWLQARGRARIKRPKF